MVNCEHIEESKVQLWWVLGGKWQVVPAKTTTKEVGCVYYVVNEISVIQIE